MSVTQTRHPIKSLVYVNRDLVEFSCNLQRFRIPYGLPPLATLETGHPSWRLVRESFENTRCTLSRLMRSMGLSGAVRRKRIRTTAPIPPRPAPQDRVFRTPAPNKPWLSDFTYVATWGGFIYVAFVIDAFARTALGGGRELNKRWSAHTALLGMSGLFNLP